MAEFMFSKRKVFVLSPDVEQIITSGGVPQVVRTAGRTFICKKGSVVFDDVRDKEKIERIRKDESYRTDEITEVTEADLKAIKIRTKKLKEADKEIAEEKDTRRIK